jgi:hypothetical protein
MQLTGKALFTLVLLAFVALIFFLTLDLSRVARLVPLRVAIPVLGLLILQVLLDLLPAWEQTYRRWQKADLFGIGGLQEKAGLQVHESAAEAPPRQRERSILLWSLALLAFIYLLGLLVVAPLFTLLYLKKQAGESWLLSIVMAMGIWGFLYGIFVLTLHARLYEGQLWGWFGL